MANTGYIGVGPADRDPTVSDDSVTTAKIQNNAVTGAKIAMTSDVAGDILTYTGTDYARLGIGAAGKVLKVNAGATAVEWSTDTAGTGDVVGPGSSTDDALAKFDSTTGKLVQNSNAILSDAGVLTVSNIAATIDTASQPNITGVGTIGTGVWQGTAIANAYIGTTIDATKLADGTVTNAEFQYINSLTSNAQTQIDAVPTISTLTSIAYPGSSTALNTAGGDNLVVAGTGFAAGLTATIDGTSCSTITIDSSTQVTLATPAKSASTYINGLVMVATNGLSISATVDYSGLPAWTTASGEILSFTRLTATTVTVAATGDAPITYAVTSGALPGGLSLVSSTGVISGTGTDNVGAATTYNFTITATDAQTQTSARAFSIEVNIMSNYYGDGSDGALST
jgi:hypothetical protein